MEYKRLKAYGGTFFFTLVTYQRRKIFDKIDNINLLRDIIKTIKSKHPFVIDAFVLLPDHLHCIWTLPAKETDYSLRWRLIKTYFTREFVKNNKTKTFLTASQKRKNEQPIWQRRFWEHQIRDDRDFQKHVDYIHYNPVKHGYTHAPYDWPYSSFHRYVKENIYDVDWASSQKINFEEGLGGE
jgi:putative transposase